MAWTEISRYRSASPDGALRFPTFVCFRNDKL